MLDAGPSPITSTAHPNRRAALCLLALTLAAAAAAPFAGPIGAASAQSWPVAVRLTFEIGPGGSPQDVLGVVSARLDSVLGQRAEVHIAATTGNLVISLRNPRDRDTAVAVASLPGVVRFALVASDEIAAIDAAAADSASIPEGQVLAPTTQEGAYLLLYARWESDADEEALSGGHIARATAGSSPTNGDPIVNFAFDARGRDAFSRVTAAHVGERFAVLLDDRILMAPQIPERIPDGAGYIDGGFTTEAAEMLAAIITSGALPAPLTLIEETTEP